MWIYIYICHIYIYIYAHIHTMLHFIDFLPEVCKTRSVKSEDLTTWNLKLLNIVFLIHNIYIYILYIYICIYILDIYEGFRTNRNITDILKMSFWKSYLISHFGINV